MVRILEFLRHSFKNLRKFFVITKFSIPHNFQFIFNILAPDDFKDAFGNPPSKETVRPGGTLMAPPTIIQNKHAEAQNSLRALATRQAPRSLTPSMVPQTPSYRPQMQFGQPASGGYDRGESGTSLLAPVTMPISPMPVYPAIIGGGLTLIYFNNEQGTVRIHHPRHGNVVLLDRNVMPPARTGDTDIDSEMLRELRDIHGFDLDDSFIHSQVHSWEPHHSVSMVQIPEDFEGRPLPKKSRQAFHERSFPFYSIAGVTVNVFDSLNQEINRIE
jgi:hypothetical protein